MRADRRSFTFGLAAAWLAGCAPDLRGLPGGGSATAAQIRAVPNAGYDAWVMAFRARAAGQGIAAPTLDTAFRGAGYLPGVIERDRNQTEFKRSLQDYLAIAASDERVSKGNGS
jgi:membrane-bound lytic murein transglycosylase B